MVEVAWAVVALGYATLGVSKKAKGKKKPSTFVEGKTRFGGVLLSHT